MPSLTTSTRAPAGTTGPTEVKGVGDRVVVCGCIVGLSDGSSEGRDVGGFDTGKSFISEACVEG